MWSEIKAKIEEINGWNITRVKPSEKQIDAIYNLYKNIYGYHYRKTCRSCYVDCFAVIRQLTESSYQAMSELKYELKPGKVLIDYTYKPDSSVTALARNLDKKEPSKYISNEKCFWHIVRWVEIYGLDVAEKELKKYFEKYPADVLRQAADKTACEYPRVDTIQPDLDFTTDEEVEEIEEQSIVDDLPIEVTEKAKTVKKSVKKSAKKAKK